MTARALLPVVLLLVGACDPRSGPEEGSSCPVTQPPADRFTPPEGYAMDADGGTWYGTPELWTLLPADYYEPQRSWWWSVDWDPQPSIEVTWTRLDDSSVIDNAGFGANSRTSEWGWVMLAGHDPDEPGCWQVEATYQGATVTYVYEYAG